MPMDLALEASTPADDSGPLGAWPVGCVFITLVATNPSILLGGGSWSPVAVGRFLVGVDSSQAEFNAVRKTGGEKAHKLTIAEMPAHAHGGQTGYFNADHTHSFNFQFTTTVGTTGSGQRVTDIQDAAGGGGTYKTANTRGSSANHLHGIASDGGGQAHPILPPYLGVYMWERTA